MLDNNYVYNLHNVNLPQNYKVNLFAHLENQRDNEHFITTLKCALDNNIATMLDIGSWDGWLPLLIARNFKSIHVSTCEWILNLLEAGEKYAKEHNVKNYYAYHGNWLDLPIENQIKWDLVTCFEVLEHVQLEQVNAFIQKIEQHAKHIIISLPDQKHEDNKQHQWTPTKVLIEQLFQNKKNLQITYKKYVCAAAQIQSNWFIFYDTE